MTILLTLYRVNDYFNSHPHEEDDDFFCWWNCHFVISTHILTKRMTFLTIHSFTIHFISTHILTKRMTVSSPFGRLVNIFQLTSSRRGWPQPPHPYPLLLYISTHILTKRMTIAIHTKQNNRNYFNSHPHEEDDPFKQYFYSYCLYFNSHPHEEDDGELYGTVEHFIFQLTSSRRGWQNGIKIQLGMIKFQLTSSRRGWQSPPSRSFMITVFQLTSSRRGWRCGCTQINQKAYFNSHPHEEDDKAALTEQNTALFQLTSSRRGWLPSFLCWKIFIIFQLTSSRRGWRRYGSECLCNRISTHILTKRMTITMWITLRFTLFQLTSSRRGWRMITYRAKLQYYFNSHPHEEDDGTCRYPVDHSHFISTHILTKRMTIVKWIPG